MNPWFYIAVAEGLAFVAICWVLFLKTVDLAECSASYAVLFEEFRKTQDERDDLADELTQARIETCTGEVFYLCYVDLLDLHPGGKVWPGPARAIAYHSPGVRRPARSHAGLGRLERDRSAGATVALGVAVCRKGTRHFQDERCRSGSA